MFLLTLLAVSPLVLAPLPAELPDSREWEVSMTSGFRMSVTEVLMDTTYGGLALKFLETRGICRVEPIADCTLTARYELRRKMEGDKMVAFIQHFAIIDPVGKREEGVGHFYFKEGEPVIDVYFRKGDRWLTEEPQTEEYFTATGILAVLAARHQTKF